MGISMRKRLQCVKPNKKCTLQESKEQQVLETTSVLAPVLEIAR